MKTITKAPPIGIYYPLQALRGLPTASRVDKKRRIIFGAAVIQLGDTNDDREVFADDTTLAQVIKLGASHTKGLKGRFTHPNMSDDGLGKFLGRWRKFRLSEDGSTVLGDFHFSNMAFRGEDGGRGQYVLDLAEQEPDMFGVSIAPRWDREKMEKLEEEDGRMPMRFKSLLAADIVDSPTATRGGLFGDSPLSITSAPHQATEALDSLFVDAQPDVIRGRVSGFLDSYLANRFSTTHKEKEPIVADENKSDAVTVDTMNAAIGAALSTAMKDVGTLVTEAVAKAVKPEETSPEQSLSEEDHKKGLAAERTRCKELLALSKNAGLSDHEKVADQWIDKGLSVIEAKATIGDLAIAKNGLSADTGEDDPDPDKKYRDEYRKGQPHYMQMGLSEKEFITSRKIDEGEELLAAAS